MIQINLLPDVKLQFLRTQRTKRLVFLVAGVVTAVSVGAVVLMLMWVYGAQAKHASDLQNDIDGYIKQYTNIENLDTVLTVREQLLELPILHNDKPAVTRLPGFLAKIVLTDEIKLSELYLDFTDDELRLSGRGKDTKTINTFADVLKNAVYSYGDGTNPSPVFADVEFDISVTGEDGSAFDARMSFDPEIFDITNEDVSISVPSTTSTQSFIRSTSLFDQVEEEE